MERKKDLYTFFEIFSDKKIAIPLYQRGYSWREDQLNTLYKDIEFINLEHGYKHFMSEILFDEYANHIDLADGQQRILSMLMLLFSLIKNKNDGDYIGKLNEMKISDIKSIFIKNNTPIIQTSSDKNYNIAISEIIFNISTYDGDGKKIEYKDNLYIQNLKHAMNFFTKKLLQTGRGAHNEIFDKLSTSLLFHL
jgi:uncharacterized protein with ParB-like and HNH nuclease domain